MTNELVNKIKRNIANYAEQRLSDVQKSLETRRFAAFAVEKYVWGVYETLMAQEFKECADDILKYGDCLCLSIDHEFKDNKKYRWSLRPADFC